MAQLKRNHLSGHKDCGCGGHPHQAETFDAQTAIQRLSKKFDDLAQVVAASMATTPVPKGARGVARGNNPPQTMKEALARIVGGFPVDPGEFPDCALVGRKNPNGSFSWFCTGVLIHPRLVLTAALCFDPASPANIVALNTENQSQLANAEIQSVRRMVIHPEYQLTGLHDIAVMVLRKNAKVKPVPPASTTQLTAARQTTLVGFGNDDVLSTRGFGIKREVTVPITHSAGTGGDVDEAEEEFGFESDLEFVAGGSGFDSCNGDSGGPAYITAGGKRLVAGLTSRATDTARNPCGEGGIYTRVDVHMDFIRDVAASAKVKL
jgi:secreted trypsin-like serine protease